MGRKTSRCCKLQLKIIFVRPQCLGRKTTRCCKLQLKINFSAPWPGAARLKDIVNYNRKTTPFDPTTWVGQLPDIMIYNWKSTFFRTHGLNQKASRCCKLWLIFFWPHGLGRETPRCCKLESKINFFEPTAWVGKLPDAVNYNWQSTCSTPWPGSGTSQML